MRALYMTAVTEQKFIALPKRNCKCKIAFMKSVRFSIYWPSLSTEVPSLEPPDVQIHSFQGRATL